MFRAKHTLITIIINTTVTTVALQIRSGCNFWELLGRFICALFLLPCRGTGSNRCRWGERESVREPPMCKQLPRGNTLPAKKLLRVCVQCYNP
uniref:Putative secreted protein n=1 Tax=Anopheles marajoara TaxID=58244 RepID=A0A2M4CA61_9DIPT